MNLYIVKVCVCKSLLKVSFRLAGIEVEIQNLIPQILQIEILAGSETSVANQLDLWL